ncbi:MAG TPA: peroxide stress protein YaaA [Actinomycetes bacterium]|nr:peroxide stress protein YaaA [Actinomycetes bacterium]
MLVLLPPSEAKAAGGDGPPVGRRPALSTPSLGAARGDLLAAIRAAARTDRTDLVAGLRLPASVADAALRADLRAATAPTMPALRRYAGVLYQALDVGSLPSGAARRAEAAVIVASGLWGVVRGADLVPDYRVPASGRVPGFGGVAAHWRGPLAALMPSLVGEQAVLDLRSTDYLAMWRPAPALRGRVLQVRVLADPGTGRAPTGVSYHAKWVKGLLVRHLALLRRWPADPSAAVTAAAAALDLTVLDSSTPEVCRVDLVGRYP